MDVVTKERRIMRANSSACIAYEYPAGDKDINVAFVEIRGRYPDSGQVTNEVVKEIVFVSAGKGKIIVEGKEYGLESGDSVLINPREKYSLEGKLDLVISSTPAWYPEQHKEAKG